MYLSDGLKETIDRGEVALGCSTIGHTTLLGSAISVDISGS